MQITVVINKRRNGKLLLEILGRREFDFDALEEIVAFLESTFSAVVVGKLEAPTDERIWDLQIENRRFVILFDPMIDFEITAEKPEGEETLWKIANALKDWYRERGFLREFITEPEENAD